MHAVEEKRRARKEDYVTENTKRKDVENKTNNKNIQREKEKADVTTQKKDNSKNPAITKDKALLER